MKTNRTESGAHKARYGPAPGGGRGLKPLSGSRTSLLATLRAQPGPVTIAALVELTDLHANTVREHLDGLLDQGLVRRRKAEPSGSGRPAWLFEATGGDPASSTEYAGLASTLAAAIHRTSSSPRDDAVVAGIEWGRELARDRGAEPLSSGLAARREVVAILEDLGFAPQPNQRNSLVRLTQCPLLDAAHKYPDVVCGVHLGITRGALEEYGADPEGTDLLPFAEPGACRLWLQRRR